MAFAVRFSRQQAGFRQIREDHVGAAAKAAHSGSVGLIKAGIKPSVIRHDGINDNFSVRRKEGLQELLQIIDLAHAAEVSGIDGVKPDLLLPPMANNFREFIRKIMNGKARKPAGVGGQDSGRQNTGFRATV